MFDKYSWIYDTLYFACIFGHTITGDDSFWTAMFILGIPVAGLVIGCFALEGSKLVFDRPFNIHPQAQTTGCPHPANSSNVLIADTVKLPLP